MSTPFHEVRFPDHIAVGAVAVVRSRTAVYSSGGGQEHRFKRWSGQLRKWDAARGIRTTTDLEEVRAFHVVMDGRHAGFRFRDFSDYQATDQRLDTSAGGSVFQLRRGYTAGSVTKWRKITKPAFGAVLLTLNGREVLVGSAPADSGVWGEDLFGDGVFGAPEGEDDFYRATVDHTTGLVTMVTPATLDGDDVLLGTFDFDVPVRFDSDELEVKARARGRVWEWGTIPIKELRQ